MNRAPNLPLRRRSNCGTITVMDKYTYEGDRYADQSALC